MVSIEIIGRRCYLVNLPFAKKDEAKHTLGMSGHNWDADRRQWWCSANKKLAAQNYVNCVNAGAPEATSGSKKQATMLGLEADAPACVVADALAEAGDDKRAAAVRASLTDAEIDASRVLAKVRQTHDGRVFYVIGEAVAQGRCFITTLDRAVPEWRDMADFVVLRRYQMHRTSNTRTAQYQTIGGLRSFRDRQRNPATASGECYECGTWGPKGETCRDCHEGTHL